MHREMCARRTARQNWEESPGHLRVGPDITQSPLPAVVQDMNLHTHELLPGTDPIRQGHGGSPPGVPVPACACHSAPARDSQEGAGQLLGTFLTEKTKRKRQTEKKNNHLNSFMNASACCPKDMFWTDQ